MNQVAAGRLGIKPGVQNELQHGVDDGGTLMELLSFGCARLTGSFASKESTRLLHACVSHGISRLDLAPSYGIGTAESLVGHYSASFSENPFRITTKIGSSAARWPHLKILGRQIKRTANWSTREKIHNASEPFVGPVERSHSMNFEVGLAQQSLTRSLKELRLNKLDALLLHELGRLDASKEIIYWLSGVKEEGLAAKVGYSISGQFDSSFDVTLPNCWVGQAAPRTEWFLGGGEFPARPITFHSLYKSFGSLLERTRLSQPFLEQTKSIIRGPWGQGAMVIAASVLILHALIPSAKFIVATSSVKHLNEILNLVGTLDRDLLMRRSILSVWCGLTNQPFERFSCGGG